MRTPLLVAVGSTACLAFAVSLTNCTHACGLGLHAVVQVKTQGSSDRVPCCGGFLTKDLTLLPSTEGQVSLTNIDTGAEPVDAFLVPTSCSKLFDGAYPGAQPLCQVYSGPVALKAKGARVGLGAGTYRLWLQAYSTNTSVSDYSVSFDVLDYRCLPIVGA